MTVAGIEADLVSFLTPLLGVPVGTKVPPAIRDQRPPEFVVLRRSGGGRRTPVSDQAVIDVEAWAQSESDAEELLGFVADGIRLMQTYSVVESHVSNYPDGESTHARYIGTYTIHRRGVITGRARRESLSSDQLRRL